MMLLTHFFLLALYHFWSLLASLALVVAFLLWGLLDDAGPDSEVDSVCEQSSDWEGCDAWSTDWEDWDGCWWLLEEDCEFALSLLLPLCLCFHLVMWWVGRLLDFITSSFTSLVHLLRTPSNLPHSPSFNWRLGNCSSSLMKSKFLDFSCSSSTLLLWDWDWGDWGPVTMRKEQKWGLRLYWQMCGFQ